jgi:hypothetical protein
MVDSVLKNKIYKSLEELDAIHLQSAYQILKELVNQQKYGSITVENDEVERKIAIGIKQLDNGEGTNFRVFLDEMKASYGGRK